MSGTMQVTQADGRWIGAPQRCIATTKSHGKRCQNRPVKGTTVCRLHGGMAAQTREKAEAIAKAQRAAELEPKLFDLDAPPVTDPFAELQRLAGICRKGVDYAGELVNNLEGQIRYMSPGQGAEQLRSEVALLERMMNLYGGFLTSMVKLGLEDRMVKVNERTADTFIQVMRMLITHPDLALSPAQQQIASRIVQESMKQVAGADVVVEVAEIVDST